MSKPDVELPVDIHGELSLEGPCDGHFRFAAAGSRLHLAAPGWPQLCQLGPHSLLSRLRALKKAVLTLETLGLNLEIDVAGRTASRFGAGVKPNAIARMLGLTSADVRFSTLLIFLSVALAKPITRQ